MTKKINISAVPGLPPLLSSSPPYTFTKVFPFALAKADRAIESKVAINNA